MGLQGGFLALAITALHLFVAVAVSIASVPLSASPVCPLSAYLETGSAHSLVNVTRGDVSISSVEWMSTFAVSLPGILSRAANSSQHVFSQGDGFHMLRVYAGTVAAEVVDTESVGDRPNESFVGEAMGQDLYSISVSSPYIILAVSSGEHRSVPVPAASLGIDLELCEKAGGQLTDVHLAIFPTSQQANSYFDDCGLRQAEVFGELLDEPQAFRAQTIAGGLFVPHKFNVPPQAVGVK